MTDEEKDAFVMQGRDLTIDLSPKEGQVPLMDSDEALLSTRPISDNAESSNLKEYYDVLEDERDSMLDHMGIVQMAKALPYLPKGAKYLWEHKRIPTTKDVQNYLENDGVNAAMLPIYMTALSTGPLSWAALASDMVVPWGYGSIPENPLHFSSPKELQSKVVDFSNRYIVPAAETISGWFDPIVNVMSKAADAYKTKRGYK